ncbi:hypothetical protein MKX01_040330, partial [Papaver californicum]
GNNFRGSYTSNGGDPISNKNLKRYVEVRYEVHCKIGFGTGGSKDLQDKIQPNNGS